MNEQLGLVQRLRNGGQNDLADDAEGLWVSLYALSYLLGFASNLIEDPKGREAVLSAVNKAHAALAQASGDVGYEASVLAEHNTMQVREDR